MSLRLRRGTNAERLLITPLEGELIYVTDTKKLYVGDGLTSGGIPVDTSGEALIDLSTSSINDLSDVSTDSTTPLDGEVLTYNSELEIWRPAAPSYPSQINSDVQGSVFGNDSTLLVDGVNSLLPAESLDGTATINITGSDETLLVDSINSLIPAENLVGTANVDIVGSVFGDDSTLIVDGINSIISVENFNSERFNFYSNVENSSTQIKIQSIDDRSILRLTRDSDSDISSEDLAYGAIFFERNDINGSYTSSIIAGRIDGIAIVSDNFGIYPESNTLKLTNTGDLGIGTYTPTSKLDVRGDAVFSGDVQAAAFKGSFMADDSSTIINGTTGAITAPGFIQFGSYTDSEINDIVPVNGMVYYNITDNRFRGFQNGVWINLDDGSAA